MAKKHYAAYLTVTLPDGTKKQLKFYGSTQKEADAKRDEAKVLNDRGLLTFNDKTPLRRYAEEYHKTYIEPRYDRVNAGQMWKRFEDVFLADLGNMPIGSIKRTHITRCLNKTADKSQSYYNMLLLFTRGVFRAAMDDGMINKNPMDGIKREQRAKGERRALTQEERKVIFPILQTDPRYAFFAVMLGCGLRPGEVEALTWPCVNFVKGEITVAQNHKADGSFGSPKTKSGYRTVPMPEFVANVLRQIPRTSTLVFMDVNYHYRWVKLLQDVHAAAGGKVDCNGRIIVCGKDIGEDIVPYYLRHTFCTMMAENEVPIKTAQKYMGHANARMIMEIYSHTSEKMEQQAKEKMANMFAI